MRKEFIINCVPLQQHLEKIRDTQSRIDSCGKMGHKGQFLINHL